MKKYIFKIRLFGKKTTEYQRVMIVSTTAYVCRNKNAKGNELESYLNEPVQIELKNKIYEKIYQSIIYIIMGNASNQGAQFFLKFWGTPLTSDIGAPGALASGIFGLLSNGISGLLLPIGILAGLYIISQKL